MTRRRQLLALPAAALARPAGAADPTLQAIVLQEVNAARAHAGRPALRLDPRLSQAALLHARDMLARGDLSHRGGDGSDPGLRISRAGYRWRSYRENVGAGYLDARQAMGGWMSSPGHRANVLADDVTEVGIGHAEGPGMMPGNIPRRFWTLVLAAPR
jgi:uncharacterized protein YkwD